MRGIGKRETPRVGQSTLEFVWVMVAICIVLVAMQTLLRRAIGGRYRSSIDQLSQQHFDPTTQYNSTTRSSGTRTDSTDSKGKSVSKVADSSTEVSTQSMHIGSTSELVVEQTGDLK